MTESADKKDRMEFQTEAKQLLSLMIHSLYSHKEIFLREIIANASDALDKLRFEAVTNPALLPAGYDPAIRIKLDKTAKTITISDNGIGMSRDEVIANLGTIARSGSKAFFEKLSGDQKADTNLIGQFGVGFYSIFMVASSVKVVTRRAGTENPAIVWESDGVSDYTLGTTDKEAFGTEVTLYLKETETSYTELWSVRSLIKKYSDFIAFPIVLPDDKGKDETINTTKPIWKRVPTEVTPENYEEFFHQLGGFDKPLATIHHRAEGITEFSALLYLPSKAGFDLFNYERAHGIKLYVKRVFVMDNCKEMIPEYLRFVKGVVDSEDLPLNVSREILQHNPLIEKIKKAIVTKILSRLKEMAETAPTEYATFWGQFGPVIKEGLHSDHDNKEKLMELVRFGSSSQPADALVSLKEYVSRMKPDQKDIYYIASENRSLAEKSPHMEVFRDKGIEVLFMIDPIDEFIVGDIYIYDGKTLKSVTKGDLDLGDIDKKETAARKKSEAKFKTLVERIKGILADTVKDVRVTSRLKDSPCCLVTDEDAMSSQMERLMKSMGQEAPKSKRTFEINVEHPIMINLNTVFEKDNKDLKLDEWIKLLYDQALIAEGQMVSDPLAYTKRVNELLVKVSGQ